jgi:hypothetical protein
LAKTKHHIGVDMISLNAISGTQRLFTYKVAHDGGSAPNPFNGLCTLAICKPAIRRVAKQGDVIVGLGCGKDESRIIYCMEVHATVTWAEYIEGCKSGSLAAINNIENSSLAGKIPKNAKDQGDCIWKDARSYSEALDSWSGHEGEGDFNRDVSNGENVLIGHAYWYFGKGDKHKIILPKNLENIIPGRGHRSNSNNDFRSTFVEFFNDALFNSGIINYGKLGTPTLDPDKADKQTCSRCRVEEREADAIGEES